MDSPLIVIVRVPDITAYADEPSTFQKPISWDRCSEVTPRSARHFSTSAIQLAGAFGFNQRQGAIPSMMIAVAPETLRGYCSGHVLLLPESIRFFPCFRALPSTARS